MQKKEIAPLTIVAAAVVVCLVAYAGFAFARTPSQKPLLNTFETLQTVKSIAMSGSLDGLITTIGRVPNEKDITNSGSFSARWNMATDMSSTSPKWTLSASVKASSALTSLPNDTTLSLEARFIHDTIYIKASNIPALPFLDKKLIENVWIRMPVLRTTNSSSSPSSIYKEKVSGYMTLYPPLKLTSRGSAESINGQATTRYNFALDTKNIKTILSKLAEDAHRTIPESDLKSIDALVVSDGTIWIGSDNLPYKVSFVLHSQSGSPDFSIESSIKTNSIVEHYNTPVLFTEPSSSQTWDEIMKKVLPRSSLK